MKGLKKRSDPLGFVLPFTLLMVWYFVTESGKIPPYLLPGPKRILDVFLDFTVGGKNLTSYSAGLIDNLGSSCIRVMGGFGLATLSGVLLGFLTGTIPLVKRIIDPTIHMMRAIPGVGWLPLAMVWFGIGQKTTIFLIALTAFFPIYINTTHGVSKVPPLFIRAGKMLGADRFHLLTTILLPAAFPSILVGLRLGLSTSWAYLVLGEITGVTKGLGAVMMDSRMMGQVDMILVAMITIGTLGKLSDKLLIEICEKIYPYRREKVKPNGNKARTNHGTCRKKFSFVLWRRCIKDFRRFFIVHK